MKQGVQVSFMVMMVASMVGGVDHLSRAPPFRGIAGTYRQRRANSTGWQSQTRSRLTLEREGDGGIALEPLVLVVAVGPYPLPYYRVDGAPLDIFDEVARVFLRVLPVFPLGRQLATRPVLEFPPHFGVRGVDLGPVVAVGRRRGG
jgi:hypothetical protein